MFPLGGQTLHHHPHHHGPCVSSAHQTGHVLSLFHILNNLDVQNRHDALHCQLDGAKEILLVDSQQSPDILDILDVPAPPFGMASFMNTLNVDYDKYPALTKVNMFHIALLGPGMLL